MIAYAGEHAANLMVAAFADRYAHAVCADCVQLRRAQRCGFTVQHQCAAGENRRFMAGKRLR